MYLFHYCRLIILLLFDFHSILFAFCFPFDSFAFDCSLFMRKYLSLILDCISGISIPLYKKYHYHLCKSINILRQTAPSLSSYRSEWPIRIIDMRDIRNQYSPSRWSKQRARHVYLWAFCTVGIIPTPLSSFLLAYPLWMQAHWPQFLKIFKKS